MTAPQQIKNYVQTTLALACTSAATTLTLTSAAGLPTIGPFSLQINDQAPATTFEIVSVTSMAGAVATVVRGQEGTTGIAHNPGAFVGNNITAGMLNSAFPLVGYRARAYASTAQGISATTWTKILLDTNGGLGYDPNSNFDVTTNHRYTAPVNGYYDLKANVAFTTQVGFSLALYVNGVSRTSLFNCATGAAGTASGSDEIYLNATDYVEVFVFCAAGATLSNPVAGGQNFLAVQYMGQ